MIRPKHVMDFVHEDKGLSEKQTVEEFEASVKASNREECTVGEAFQSYKHVLEECNK